jgi:hypothetical protein
VIRLIEIEDKEEDTTLEQGLKELTDKINLSLSKR